MKENEAIQSGIVTLHQMSEDEKVKWQCLARQDNEMIRTAMYHTGYDAAMEEAKAQIEEVEQRAETQIAEAKQEAKAQIEEIEQQAKAQIAEAKQRAKNAEKELEQLRQKMQK